jgi:integrase
MCVTGIAMARTRDKLTAVTVRTARFEDRARKLFDGAGLYLHLQESGKYWRLKYRWGGKERLLALGVYPDVPLQEARQRRDDARELLARGIDPMAHRRAARAATVEASASTFEVIAREWFESVHQRRVVSTHAGRNLRRLELYIFPALGRRPIAEIAPTELLAALRRVVDAGHVETAHRLRSLCGQILRYAITTGRANRDIAADLRDALPTASTTHHPAIVSPAEIPELLRAIDGYGGYPATRNALKLASLVFVRPGELRKAEWEDFNLGVCEWDYRPSKGGAPVVLPLPRQAVAVLREMESLSGRGKYVFPSVRGKGRPMSENTVNAALHRLGYKDVMTGHGFRAMARTVLVERLNFPAEYVEHQLAHTVRDPLGRAYNRTTFLEQRQQMLQAWADYLDELRNMTPEQ